MIDDKKIEEAATIASISDTEKGHVKNGYVVSALADHENGYREGYIEGAKWAINEFIKDLWHPASEKPILRNGKCLVVYNSGKIDIFKISFVYEMLSNYGKDSMGWKCWAYVFDLFPNEGCNHD